MKSFPWLALAVVAACSSDEGSSSSSLTQPPGQCGEIETHVFGIYQAPGGHASVHVNRPGHHALVVSAHDSTTWTITTGPDAFVDAVYAVGIERQSVKADTGVQVARDSQEDGGPYACGYTYPYDGKGCNTDQLLNLASKIVNHGATSFHGCYMASSFTVAEDLRVSADCNTGGDTTSLTEFVACLGPDSCGGPIIL